VDSKAEYSA